MNCKTVQTVIAGVVYVRTSMWLASGDIDMTYHTIVYKDEYVYGTFSTKLWEPKLEEVHARHVELAIKEFNLQNDN